MPKKNSLPPKPAQNPSEPPEAKPHPCVKVMLRDLAALEKSARKLAVTKGHTEITPTHFLYTLLRDDKFQPTFQNFFQDYSSNLKQVLSRIERKLKGLNTKANSSQQEPALTPQCEELLQNINQWFIHPRHGYCLPFICLAELYQLDSKSYVPKFLRKIGIESTSEIISELTYLETQNLNDLPDDLYDHRSLEEKQMNRVHRELLRMTEEATRFAIIHHQRYLLPEHLLLVFLTNPKFHPYLTALPENIDLDGILELAVQLNHFLVNNNEECKGGQMPEPTPAFLRLTTKTLNLSKPDKGLSFFPPIFLLAILKLQENLASQLEALGFTQQQLVFDAKLLHRFPTDSELDDTLTPPAKEDAEKPFDFAMPFEEPNSALEEYAIELVELARQGKIDPLIGRQQELDRLVEILHKKRSSNALIVGNEGVGKTAIVEGLALRIAQGEIPDTLKDYKIYALNLGAMIAGTEFRGAFEQRLTNCIKEVSEQPKCFLFIDEIHTILGAGSGGRDGTLDAGNILKPYLARGEIRCIGATTYDEYQKRILTDRAFARRFMHLSLTEPSQEETLQILQGLLPAYEKFHKVKFSAEILPYIVELSARYLSGKFFPDKAIEVMDECGAHYRSGIGKGKKVTKADVERVICRMANLPSLTVQSNDRDNLRDLDKRLKANIFGQDEAIQELVRRVKVAKAGFQDARRPLLTAFLCGPSGCGKTELARQLAVELGIAFVKLDMSEYNEEYAASRLIGSAPGYVGYDRPGALTEPVIQTPHCLLLLDEIEKAHTSVFNLLLQVLDEGRLTDNKGREASFRNTIILMTSNAGSRDSADAINLMGFAKTDDDQSKNRQEIIQRVMQKTFPPEFRNRIQVTVMMNDLTPQAMESIVKKTLAIANQQLAKQQVTIELTPAAITQIATQAATEHLGGRPVERIFEQVVKQHIVDELLFGKLANGGKVTIDYVANTFQYSY